MGFFPDLTMTSDACHPFQVGGPGSPLEAQLSFPTEALGWTQNHISKIPKDDILEARKHCG